ncbi:MAG TPA: glucoamylase family protein [Ohtaekwangia sp.]|uniref:GH36-type glycosyl hydrolase domain-containing protein n=1 Tax=Ohtaekwangia sp. TaxID=2066019 RepID=UPI002F92EAEB
MKVKSATLEDFLDHLRLPFQKDYFTREDVNERPPLRSELYSADQMDQHAHELASRHILETQPTPELLLNRLAENEEILLRVAHLLQQAVKEKKPITPAGEWLLDNFYLIEEQIRMAKRHLPKGYSKGLPRIANGKAAGFPRVYDIATEIISHSDGHLDINGLSNFIASYQKVNYLTLGELWAIPIVLRLALLENLSRVAARIAIDRLDEDLANYWTERILETAEKDSKNLVLVIADMARSNPPMVSAFIAAFSRKLQWKGPDVTLPINWIEQHLSESGVTINAMVLTENQKQAADQVSVSNSITSLRFLATMDWREFVETMSVVENTLRLDPSGIYPKMDFTTRDHYRHEIEQIAKKSHTSEHTIATIVLNLANEQNTGHQDTRRIHVGYYLIGPGRKLTARQAQMSSGSGQAIRDFCKHHAAKIYSIGAALITLSITAGLLARVYNDFTDPLAFYEPISGILYILLAVFTLITASQFALSITNWIATLTTKPMRLPKMNFATGIPTEYRTLVVVPSLVGTLKQVEKLLEELEVRFLANRDSNLLFGLLTDFKDADQQTLPEDIELTEALQKGIEQLNRKYSRVRNDTFFLFHRPRLWNAQEKCWMGYERKRGKLTALNQLLLHNETGNFSLIVGSEQIYRSIKYIITLDADTQLPRDAAWKLVGIMAHPLNQPIYSIKEKRVTEGYGIIQPRIAISLHGAERTRYTHLHENDSGIDPYTQAVSDVYQDVFTEGSFIGKGIYDVEVFEKVLGDRFPENRILSHDLIEGAYVRCGYASDIQLYEDYPSSYRVDINRRHRWIRGDWQIWNWCLPYVPGKNRKLYSNPVSALSRWKIFDNLRRSLVPICLTALYILTWLALPSPLFWTICITGLIIAPAILASLWSVVNKPSEVLLRHHLLNALRNTYRTVLQATFTIVCLPYEACISADAIMRTGWRMFISRKKLLEWNPSGFVLHNHKENLAEVYIRMFIAPLLSLGILCALIKIRPEALAIAAPFLILWMLAPATVWWLNQPLQGLIRELSIDQKSTLRELSRKIWAFFEDLVGPADNWLPPDNLQEYPIPVVAHRTSPTNIGLSLLANLTAVDFGYIPLSQFIERTHSTFETLEKLERYQGHFYNWYETTTLRTLHPRYISTVDSGNLAGHLITLKQGILHLRDRRIADRMVIEGLHDTVRLIINNLPAGSVTKWENILKDIVQLLMPEPILLQDIKTLLENLLTQATTSSPGDTKTQAHYWITTLRKQAQAILNELKLTAPWLFLSPVPEKFIPLKVFSTIPTLAQLTGIHTVTAAEIPALPLQKRTAEEEAWLEQFNTSLRAAAHYARQQLDILDVLAAQCTGFASMEYDFLYDKSQHLFAIGYNAETYQRDSSYYDLLASEARLSSFVAIAQGKVSQENWFALGRRLTTAGNTPVLLSWSGSMFEYLMPMLVMPSYTNTLLDETMRGTVKKQIEHGRQHAVPWGISESCYNVVDSQLIYQYRAFGTPGLGFKRGLGEDLVIAPYATVMALMVNPDAACHNLDRLREEGFEGRYGFYESVDYTPSRLPRGQSRVLIQTFMAHHQGMSLLSLAYILLDQPMQKRFEADPEFQTALLLLQERVPNTISFHSAATDMQDVTPAPVTAEMRVIGTADTPTPEVQLLSNGRYHVMVTNAGGGYSRWKDTAITRWREDSTRDHWGSFCYIRDLDSGIFWSSAHQPTLKEADQYAAVFSQGRVEFRRLDQAIETHTEIIVSPEDDIEIRRIHIANRSRRKRKIEITSYAEVVLNAQSADLAHTAFSNLFVQTEILANQQAILATRRPRSHEEQPPWMMHLIKYNGTATDAVSYETDRAKFIGRGNAIAHPQVMQTRNILSNTQGSVLDPIVAIQYRITLEPDEAVTWDIVTGIAATRGECQSLIDRYQDPYLRDRTFELSWTHSQVVLRQINASESDAQVFGQLASAVLYTNPALRAKPAILQRNQRGQSALWSYSISGDLPIVLLRVSDSSNITLVRQLVQAHAYWQLKGLAADLVIVNEDHTGYRQVLQDQIHSLLAAGIGFNGTGRRGGIFIRSSDQIPNEDWVLLQTVARVIIADTRGNLTDQISKRTIIKAPVDFFEATITRPPSTAHAVSLRNDLAFFNGYGGFTQDGKEYCIYTTPEQHTPLPWINVIANKHFGTIASESGLSYTWAENAHEYRLSPWHNDPVTNQSGEALYIRDEDTGYYWSPMPLPVRGKTPYYTRHGFGYTVYEHTEDNITSEVWVYVDLDAAIRFIVIKLKNLSGTVRRLSVTGYIEWVLSDLRDKSVMHVTTQVDPATRAILATNAYNTEFNNRIAFFDTDEEIYSFTCDRTEFIGRNGTPGAPAAMKRTHLSGKYGAGLDACTAVQVPVELESGREQEIVFRVGAALTPHEATETIRKFRGRKTAQESLARVHQFWNKTLGAVYIETPDQALNYLTNGWLLYQVLSSRLWGRSGFYQSGGAYGFRDQLQDVMALLHTQPSLAREQIVLAASRQFREGDVQHWWHPPVGRGVRTQCSDDFLWLPYVTSRYVVTTGDIAILEETAPFLEGRPLNNGEESYYDLPILSGHRASIYEHCKRAIQRGLVWGEHGLPLIGSGDWNDGMNMVGIHGKGESTWLAFFLYDVLKRFETIAILQHDDVFAQECSQHAEQLRNNIHTNAWDGQWYIRAFYDDGTPLGSSGSDECRIDSISQSWSVLSGAGDRERSIQAMQSAEQYLVRREYKLIQLLDPPFNTSEKDPGYIKGYVPGVRENGGQYTHAAVWMVMAFARLGDQQRTWELLNMINPLTHGKNHEDIAIYKTEPYVMAADVYGVAPHTSRGGWTWYTGSAGWMYQLIIESFLGIHREGDTLRLQPCLPKEWNTVTVQYRYDETIYNIMFHQAVNNEAVLVVDGIPHSDTSVKLINDRQEHTVRMALKETAMGNTVHT